MTLNIAPLTVAGFFALSIGALAQAPPPTSHIPQPQTAQPPKPESQPASQPATNGTRGSRAEADAPTLGELTITGCVEREADYRAAHGQAKGGPNGTGLGQGNEYVLTHATSGSPVPTSGSGVTESV